MPGFAYSNFDLKLFYWRTRSGVEVDFVAYGSDGFWAVEVKHSATVRREHVRSLRAFAADYPACEPLLLYRGSDRLLLDGVKCIPAADFLSRLEPDLALTDL